MNIQSHLTMDGPTFLAWVQGREGRFELAKSRVMMMTGGSRGHAIVARRLSNGLEQRLDSTRWTVLTSDFAVEIEANTIRYPDVVVDAAGGQPKDLTAIAPIVIAEVISPSSATYDLGDKAAEYLRLPTLAAYVVLSQDEPKAWVWSRSASGFSPGPEVIVGQEAIIRVAALAIELPLADIYKGFDLS
jgi:Uma2 family endonuclease